MFMHLKSYQAMAGASTRMTLPSRRFSHHVFCIMRSAFDTASPSSWIRTDIWRYQSCSRFSQKADRRRGGYSILPQFDDRGRQYLIGPRTDGAHNVTECLRSFGGQSIVPWELALFLIEEMRGEGVVPGAVVYTSALAECRWACQSQHVRYLMDQMEAEGLHIVPGIPGATDNELPPSQMLEVLRSPSSPTTPSTTTQAAIHAAESALATVEAMWAGGKHEPSPETCRAALEACAAGGQWERALSLVRDSAKACAAKTTPGGKASATLIVQVELLARSGKWDKALALVQPEANMPDTR